MLFLHFLFPNLFDVKLIANKRRPPSITLSILHKKIEKYKKTPKNDNMRKMQKYTKIQASVQHGLYLFTCEISSVNSTPSRSNFS